MGYIRQGPRSSGPAGWGPEFQTSNPRSISISRGYKVFTGSLLAPERRQLEGTPREGAARGDSWGGHPPS